MNLLKDLNNKQCEVVSAYRQNLLILAGAGSGKTLVLIRRIAWLINKMKCSSSSILAVTFTNKAAKELKERIKNIIHCKKDYNNIWIGTFHSFAYYILRIHYVEAKLPKHFQIINNDDQKKIIKHILQNNNFNEKIYNIDNIIKYINFVKNSYQFNNYKQNNNIIYKNLHIIFNKYQKLCKQTGILDFNELIIQLYELFLNNPSILDIYQQKYKNIFIDEFQDTNDIQYNFINLLYNKEINTCITVVGDDDQSIYSWRGAKVENINRFLKDFYQAKIILLEQNYRSTNNILNAANKLISYNINRVKKTLWTNSNNGHLITIYLAYNEFDEAEYIARYIQKYIINNNLSLSDCAILYRNNTQSRIIEEKMLQFNIPYYIYGGIRFFERQEIKHVLSYLKLISNYNNDIAFERIYNIPKRGIGKNTFQIIKTIANKLNISLWESSILIIKKKNINTSSLNALIKFIKLIQTLKQNTLNDTLPNIIKKTIVLTGLQEMYSKNSCKIMNDKDNSILNNLQELINSSKHFMYNLSKKNNNISINKQNILVEFLSQSILQVENIDINNKHITNNKNYIQLMTIHASKGLEFNQVFIIGMEEGIFPNKISIYKEKNIYEERRLAYVGMTRAKKKLILTYTKNRYIYGKEINTIPSRFINELPICCVKNISYLNFQPNYTPKKIKLKNSIDYYVGQKVNHNIFGKGIILKIEILKKDFKLKIKFDKIGIKWIMSNYINNNI
ncbi:UvrD-helicase domain-containing protein [Enterobacteriaceae endosymbiont of Neohaemonia nigricornis]|uniref:UvrD-helicase domain-containing protein n=1 Tax=Enterobacteriaceae endosymbiont of Neohaemonia nigricornis TaxID=2675792 RepID=UPI001B3AEAB8|nr:UvrD-helicase domain-containing protein [Enterobacteriaceae endosymbiont of Neohaemonia nigricornis]